MELQCRSRMLPALFRRCTALSVSSTCQQLVSLATFRTHRLLPEPLVGSTTTTVAVLPATSSTRRDIRAFSRKRNIFLDPAERDENLKTLTVSRPLFIIYMPDTVYSKYKLALTHLTLLILYLIFFRSCMVAVASMTTMTLNK